MNPLLKCDYYKTEHYKQYPDNITKLYSNFTPRKSRIAGIDKVVFFGLQHFILEYLIKDFNENFFYLNEENRQNIRNKVIREYSKHIKLDSYKHIYDLFDLGYLPIEIKSLEEGTLCPIGVPCFTITNTHPDFAWLVNYLETLISCMLWQPITSATIAYEYKKILNKYALETTGSDEGVQWQAHDFSMRGMSSLESAVLSGMGHLTSFTGTDVIPAIYQLEKSYDATGLIGASVPATEHSVECMNAQGTMEGEYEHTLRLLKLYPIGIISKVSDTTDLWSYITKVLPKCKTEILARDGKLVIRPDSGDPVDIICGYNLMTIDQLEEFYYSLEYRYNTDNIAIEKDGKYYKAFIDEWSDGGIRDFGTDLDEEISSSELKGVIELLWDVFGGIVNEQGYKVLDSHIGAIYGDSITMDRAIQICERLKAKGFSTTNIVLGIGSYTYQYNTRDTFGFAMKATYGEITHKQERDGGINFGEYTEEIIEHREIFKDPITDDGIKKSKKGLLQVRYKSLTNEIICNDQQSWKQEKEGLLQIVFKNGKLTRTTTLEEIRNKLK